jgi:hypothetical protein
VQVDSPDFPLGVYGELAFWFRQVWYRASGVKQLHTADLGGAPRRLIFDSIVSSVSIAQDGILDSITLQINEQNMVTEWPQKSCLTFGGTPAVGTKAAPHCSSPRRQVFVVPGLRQAGLGRVVLAGCTRALPLGDKVESADVGP